jgi:hypothetical protein
LIHTGLDEFREKENSLGRISAARTIGDENLIDGSFILNAPLIEI